MALFTNEYFFIFYFIQIQGKRNVSILFSVESSGAVKCCAFFGAYQSLLNKSEHESRHCNQKPRPRKHCVSESRLKDGNAETFELITPGYSREMK